MQLSKSCKIIPMNKGSKDFKMYVGSCLTKKVYKTKKHCIEIGWMMGAKNRCAFDGYRCQFCNNWHLTHQVRGNNGGQHNCHITDRDGRKLLRITDKPLFEGEIDFSTWGIYKKHYIVENKITIIVSKIEKESFADKTE